MIGRSLSVLVLVLLAAAGTALAQPVESPSPEATPPVVLPPAGTVPATIALDVTGSPQTDPDVLEAQIRAALDRTIRPTLRPGASIRYGTIVPWPLYPLPFGQRAAVNVAMTVVGGADTAPVQSVTTVNITNDPVSPVPPSVLYLSDDPEYIQSDGLVFRGDVTPQRPARLYYYHSAIGLPRDLDVVLTAAVPSLVQVIASGAGPELDVMNVGHVVSRDILRFEQSNEGMVVAVAPGSPLVVRHALLLQGEVVAGAVDLHVVQGAVSASVVSAPAGSRPDAYLRGPRVAFDGHRRHGAFALDDFGATARSYTVGGDDVAVQYGGRAPTPRNLDPNDDGHDYGDYGIVHRITFGLHNPTDVPAVVYLYEKPLGGPVRSTFVVDGQMHEIGCARLQQPYYVATYQLAPQSAGASTTVTMTDGGSFYPIEYGVTATQPQPYTPPVGSPDGCSPNVPAFNDPSARAPKGS
ncbi:MAG TPA: hypothetical protein VHS78_11360 [Candidatus Elarobacter sp.]|nr:hypothetical protein [Candidatus Elarobacter sp.]